MTTGTPPPLLGRDLLGGAIVPLVTPMTAPGRPSAAATEPLLDRLAASAVDGLLLLGSNGEGPMLPAETVDDFVVGVARRWRQRRPGGRVVVNVSGVATDDARRRAERFVEADPDAVAVTPPLYFRHRSDELVAHYRAFADLGLPVVAYNIPRYTGNPITPDVLRDLIGMEHVVGLKDSSNDADAFAALLEVAAARDDFGVSQGDERRLVAGLQLGAHGIVPGFANLAPRLAVDLVAAVSRGDGDEAERLQSIAATVCEIHSIRPGVPTVKAALDLLGVCPPHAAAPLTPCTDAERSRIRAHLDALGDAFAAE